MLSSRPRGRLFSPGPDRPGLAWPGLEGTLGQGDSSSAVVDFTSGGRTHSDSSLWLQAFLLLTAYRSITSVYWIPSQRNTGSYMYVQVQTEPPVWHKGGYSKDLVLKGGGVRLLQMYNELQKRYIEEIKANQEQSEAIKNLTIKIKDLEHNLREQRRRIEQLERKKATWKSGAAPGRGSRNPEGEVTSHRDIPIKKEPCSSEYLEILLKEIQKLKKANEKLSTERRALKNELAALDKGF
ncbi:uncharacterized protein [Melanerpes formicivorus]